MAKPTNTSNTSETNVIANKNGIFFPNNTSNVFVPETSVQTAQQEKPKKSGVTAAELAAAIVYPMISAMPMSPNAADHAAGVDYVTGKTTTTTTASSDIKPSTKATEISYYDTNKVQFNSDPNGVNVDANEFEDQVLQEIGGRELLILERHDMVNGINQKYEPIKNLSKYALEYSSTNIDPYPNTAIDYFSGLIYEISEYIPTLDDLAEIKETAVVYFDETSNNIVINVKDLLDNQFVEVEFVSFDEIISDTICI